MEMSIKPNQMQWHSVSRALFGRQSNALTISANGIAGTLLRGCISLNWSGFLPHSAPLGLHAWIRQDTTASANNLRFAPNMSIYVIELDEQNIFISIMY